MEMPLHREAGVEWSVASRPAPGEAISGDWHVIAPSRHGFLVAVIDGLGHGEQATAAARCAGDVLVANPDRPVIELIQRCHTALRATRGAAMTVVDLNLQERIATALGIGNVEAVFVRADPPSGGTRESVLLRNGVVGYQLPPLQTSLVPVAPGDLVVFGTDGLREDFGDRLSTGDSLPQLVERILIQSCRGTDDALVLACRILADDES